VGGGRHLSAPSPPCIQVPDAAFRAIASGAMARWGILGSHLAGDFFLGVDILVSSMLVNFG
jgi:hypothetical protein